MSEACIVGWAHTPFGKLDDPDVESLIGRVARAAIEDAGVAPAEIDGVFVGLFNNGFSKQDFPSSMVLQSVPELRFTRATRYENACASGSAAVHGARDFIAAGRGRFALVVGAEKMTATASRPISAGCPRKCPTPPKMPLPTMMANAAAISGTYHGTNGGRVSARSTPVR